jgi:peptide/nickel transport system substrate-binding protein
MQDPEFPGAPYLGELWREITVEKLADDTVRFTLPEPSPSFLEYTTIGILPRHRLENIAARDLLGHPFNLKPIGTGPFKLDEINARFARLSPNPYFSGQKPKLAGLELRFFPSYQATIAAFQAGNVQGISAIPPQAIPQVQGFDRLNLYTSRMSGYDTIYLNLQNPDTAPFFQDAKVRQAMMMALNRQDIINTALHGQGLVANGPILPWSWAYNPNQEPLAFNPEQAKQLLAESGWLDADGNGVLDKEGVPLAFNLLVSEDPSQIEVANAVSRQWQAVGISATVEVAGAGLGERLTQRNYQAALAEVLLAGDPDPYPFWHQTQIETGQNYAGWDHTEASTLLEAARPITDTGRRSDYYYEFQRIFAEEQPALILYYPVYTYGVSKDIFEVKVTPMTNPSNRFKTIADWYMLTRRVVSKEAREQNPGPEAAQPR